MVLRSHAANPSNEQTWHPSPAAASWRRWQFGQRPGPPAPAAVRRSRMDDVVNRLARELSDAISAAIADDARVEAARERARAAGFEMKVTLEAVIGFMNRSNQTALAKIAQPVKAARTAERRDFDISANDKRFLRSLRIAADEPQEKEVE